MNTLVLGCGLIAKRWVTHLAADPRITITALADPDVNAASRLGRRGGLVDVPVFPSLETALTATRPQIVVNLTPADIHAAGTRTALEHGAHVFTEKPLTLSLDDAVNLVELARVQGRVLAVMSNRGDDRRFLAFCQAARTLSPGPYTVSTDMFVSLPAAGFRSRLPHPAIQDLAVHAFDQIQHLIAAMAVSVTCVETPLPLPGGHCSTASAHLRFADDSVFTFHGGFAGIGQRTSADGHWRIDLPTGDGCRWDGQRTITTLGPAGTASTELELPVDGHGPRITAMIDAVHGGPAVPTRLGSIALLDAALRSARSGAPAHVRQVQP